MTKKLTDTQIYALSTREEKMAVNQYREIQRKARENGGFWGETDMLIASQAVSIIVKRNERLKRGGLL